MAESGDDEEKTEEATPHREEKAREEGQVARSRELTTFMLLLAGTGGLWSLGSVLYQQLAQVMEEAFLFDRNQALEVGPMLSHGWHLGEQAMLAMLPIFLVLVLVALVAPMLLGGWLFSPEALKPQLSKLDPIKGLGRLFSVQSVVELLKVVAKALVVAAVVISFLSSRTDELMALMNQPVEQALANGLRLTALVSALMVFALVVVILIDVPYQLWDHAKKLRMSKDEIKREHKEEDGDPQIKARIRSQQQAMARRRMMSKVSDADVIVTNPTHYAVALRYDENKMSAPRVVAKGADAVAEAIRQLGREHGVPLLEAPPLARALYRHVDLDREIPVALYTAVAEVLVWAFNLKRSREPGVAPPLTPTNLPVPAELDDIPPGSDTGETP
ncbi:MAG: flagellar biosynthesis protein FlhB [Pseudomonadales bacterium]|nr:flagellar biosynthesis protein FlhB [Pseudomonadales bacterium]